MSVHFTVYFETICQDSTEPPETQNSTNMETLYTWGFRNTFQKNPEKPGKQNGIPDLP